MPTIITKTTTNAAETTKKKKKKKNFFKSLTRCTSHVAKREDRERADSEKGYEIIIKNKKKRNSMTLFIYTYKHTQIVAIGQAMRSQTVAQQQLTERKRKQHKC